MKRIVLKEVNYEMLVALCQFAPDCKWTVKGFTGTEITIPMAEQAIRRHVEETGHKIDAVYRNEQKWIPVGRAISPESRQSAHTSTSNADTSQPTTNKNSIKSGDQKEPS
jgi:hypothetical protein